MSPVRRYPLAAVGLALLAVTGCNPDTPVAQAPVSAPAQVDAVAAPSPVVVAPTTRPPVARPSKAAARSRPAARPAPTATRKPVARTVTVRRRATAAPVPKRAATTAAPKPAARTSTSGDSYPYANASGSVNDPWGFTERQCVSYAAWRLSRAGHTINNGSQGWGNASNWDDVARQRGLRVSSTPSVGAVAQWNAGESSAYYASGSSSPNGSFGAGSYGHVAYVTAVYGDGSVQVSQYNGQGDRSYSSMHVRAPRYLAF